MDGRDELLGVERVEDTRPLQPVLDAIARRMLLFIALFTPFFLLIRLAPLIGGNVGSGAIRQLVLATIAVAVIVVAAVKRERLKAAQIGWTIAVLAGYVGMDGVYRLGTNTALTSFVFLSLMSLALFVGRRATLFIGIGMWLFAIVMTVVRNQDQLTDLEKLMDVETGMIGVGSGFFSGILVVILIAEVLPGLLDSVSRAMSQRSEERQRRWYAEARSVEVENRWKAYFDQAPIGLILIDQSSCIVGWSQYNEKYLGISASDAIGQPVEDLARAFDADHPFLAKLRGLLAGQSFTAYLLEMPTERGIRQILIEGDPLISESGEFEGGFIASMDVTAYVGTGEEASGGEPLVLGQQNTLATLSAKLLGLRSALMSAGLSAETLATEVSRRELDMARVRAQSTTVVKQHAEAAHLADEAFALISGTPERDTAQHAGLLASAATAIFRSRAAREGIEMVLDDAYAQDALISRPPVLVRQILINLISNAREALTRSDTAEPRRISVRVSSEGDSVAFIVEDTAGSVLPVNRDVYFNPTYSTKGEHEDSGKGLYVSRHTAERLGGQLDVEQGEHGLRFVLTLPRHMGDETGGG